MCDSLEKKRDSLIKAEAQEETDNTWTQTELHLVCVKILRLYATSTDK